MSLSQSSHNFFDKPYLLTKEQMQHPETFFKELFGDITLSEARITLLKIVIASVSKDNSEFADAKKRSILIHFCQQVELAFEAGYILSQKNLSKTKK